MVLGGAFVRYPCRPDSGRRFFTQKRLTVKLPEHLSRANAGTKLKS